MLSNLKRNIIIAVSVGMVLYLALAIYSDFDSVLNSFRDFNWMIFPLLLLLAYLNYFTRFLKWHYYLKKLDINISFYQSYLIFMSGLSMSITPGKMGELLKSFFLKEDYGEPIFKTAPIIMVERITDFISLILICFVGLIFYNFEVTLLIGVSVFFILIVILINNQKASLRMIDLTSKVPIIKKYTPKIEEAYRASYILLKMKPLVSMTALSVVAWFFECFAFYLILITFNVNIDVLWPSLVYAFSTIAGSVTMLPAGLGVTDGSLTFLMINEGISKDISVSATFILRVVTLWFAIVVGLFSLGLYKKSQKL